MTAASRRLLGSKSGGGGGSPKRPPSNAVQTVEIIHMKLFMWTLGRWDVGIAFAVAASEEDARRIFRGIVAPEDRDDLNGSPEKVQELDRPLAFTVIGGMAGGDVTYGR